MNLEQLNTNFGIAQKAQFVKSEGGFPILEITNEHASARISVYAGQVLSFTPVGQTADLLFFSSQAYQQEGKAIKGGTPICWPWFGPDPEAQGRGSHGFVRNRLWQVREVISTQTGATKVTMGLSDTPETQAIWGHNFDLAIVITVAQTLTIDLVTQNQGTKPFTITQALHTYFQIGDINQVEVIGLENKAYLDKVDQGQQKAQTGTVTFTGECDRIYLDVPSELTIVDQSLKRQIKVNAINSKTAIVWNPGAEVAAKMVDLGNQDYLHFVCVETANAATEVIDVAPGSQYQISAEYAVDSL